MSALPSPGRAAIRDMTEADLAAVHAIEQHSYPFPWSVGIFRDCLTAGYDCTVVTDRREVIGYAVVSRAAREAHILNLCIAQSHRRMGLASELLEHLVTSVYVGRVRQLFLEVRPSNHAARRLYRRAGFRQIGVRPQYYPNRNGREDALILALASTRPA